MDRGCVPLSSTLRVRSCRKLLFSAVTDNTAKGAVFFCFKKEARLSLTYGRGVGNVCSGFILKITEVIPENMIYELSDRSLRGGFLLCSVQLFGLCQR